MSTLSLAFSSGHHAGRRAARQQKAQPRAWQPVPLRAPTRPAVAEIIGRRWLVLIAVSTLLHAVLVWYWLHQPAPQHQPAPRPLALEFVKPPEPLPEIKPPKPEPPKPLPQAAKPLPQRPVQQAAQQAPAKAAPAPQPAETAPAKETVAIAPAPPAPVVAPAADLPISDAVGRAGYLSNPPPEYPAAAARQGWEGKVLLRVRVLADGHAASVSVQQSSGRKVLDEAAVRTVQKWLFMPARQGNTAVDGWATVPIEFALS